VQSQDAGLKARVSTPLQCQDIKIKARISAPLQYSDTELEARVSHAKLDTEFEAHDSTPLRRPNAKLKTRVSDEKLDTEFEARALTPSRHPNAKLKTRVQRYLNSYTQGSSPCSNCRGALRLSYNYSHYWSSTAHVMKRVNPHYGGFLGDTFTPETSINSSVFY